MKSLLSAFLSLLLALGNGWAGPAEVPLTAREKLVEIPLGSVIDVRTKDKQRIRGRLGELEPVLRAGHGDEFAMGVDPGFNDSQVARSGHGCFADQQVQPPFLIDGNLNALVIGATHRQGSKARHK